MDDTEQALAYARADFSEANALFVDLLLLLSGGELNGRLLDLGCGPADIPLALRAASSATAYRRRRRCAGDARSGTPEHRRRCLCDGASGCCASTCHVTTCRHTATRLSPPTACCTTWPTRR